MINHNDKECEVCKQVFVKGELRLVHVVVKGFPGYVCKSCSKTDKVKPLGSMVQGCDAGI